MDKMKAKEIQEKKWVLGGLGSTLLHEVLSPKASPKQLALVSQL